MLTKVALVQWP